MSRFKRIMSFLLVLLMILPILLPTGSVLAKEVSESIPIEEANKKDEVKIIDKTEEKPEKETDKEKDKIKIEEPSEDKVTIIDPTGEEDKKIEPKEKTEVKIEEKEVTEHEGKRETIKPKEEKIKEPEKNKVEEVVLPKEEIGVNKEEKAKLDKELLNKLKDQLEKENLNKSNLKNKALENVDMMIPMDQAQDINRELLLYFIANYETITLEDMTKLLRDNAEFGLDRARLDQEEYLKTHKNLKDYQPSYEFDPFYEMLIDLFNFKHRNIKDIFSNLAIEEEKEETPIENRNIYLRSTFYAAKEIDSENMFKNVSDENIFTLRPISQLIIDKFRSMGINIKQGTMEASLSKKFLDLRYSFNNIENLTIPDNIAILDIRVEKPDNYGYSKEYYENFSLHNLNKIRNINLNSDNLIYANIDLGNYYGPNEHIKANEVNTADPYNINLNISAKNLSFVRFVGLTTGVLNISNIEVISGKINSTFTDFNVDNTLKAIGPHTFKLAFSPNSKIELFKKGQGENIEYIGEGAFTTDSRFTSVRMDHRYSEDKYYEHIGLRSNFILNLRNMTNLKYIGGQAFSFPLNKTKQDISLENLPLLEGVGAAAFYDTPREKNIVLRNLPSLRYFGTPNYRYPRVYPTGVFLSTNNEVEIFNMYFKDKLVNYISPNELEWDSSELKRVNEIIRYGHIPAFYSNTIGSQLYIEISKILMEYRKKFAYDETELISTGRDGKDRIFHNDIRSPYGSNILDYDILNGEEQEKFIAPAPWNLVIENLPNLELLDLSASIMASIQFKDDLPKIKSIDASANRLKDLDLRPLASMNKINNKAFAHNFLTCVFVGTNIKSIRPNAFSVNKYYNYNGTVDDGYGYFNTKPVMISITGGNVNNIQDTDTYTIDIKDACKEVNTIKVKKVDDTGKWNPLLAPSEFTAYYLTEEKITSFDNTFKQVMSVIRLVAIQQPDGSYKNYNSDSFTTLSNGNIAIEQQSQWIDVGTDKKVADNIKAFNDWQNIKRYDINYRTGGVHTLKNGADFEKNIKSASQVDAQNITVEQKQENGKYFIRIKGTFIFNPNTMPKEDYLLNLVNNYAMEKDIESIKTQLNNLVLSKYTMEKIDSQQANNYYAAFLGISANKDVLEEIKKYANDPNWIKNRRQKPAAYLYATTFLENQEIRKKVENNEYVEKHYLPNPQTPDEFGYLTYNIGGTYKEIMIKETKVPYGYTAKKLAIQYDPNNPENNIFVNIRKPAKYEVRYLEEGTDRQLADSKFGDGKYSEQVTEKAIEIQDYTLQGPSEQKITLADVDNVNVIIFYYKPEKVSTNKTLTINYYVEDTTSYVPDISPNPIFIDNVKEGEVININYPSSNFFVPIEGQDKSITIGKEKNVVKNIYYKPIYANYQIRRFEVAPNEKLQKYESRIYGPIIGYKFRNEEIHKGYHSQIIDIDKIAELDKIFETEYKGEKYKLKYNLIKDNEKLKRWGLNEYKPQISLDKNNLIVVDLYYTAKEVKGINYKVNYWLQEEGKENKLVLTENKMVPNENPTVTIVNQDINTIFKDYPENVRNLIKFENMDKKLPFTVTATNNVINVYYAKELIAKDITVKKINENNSPLQGVTISIYKKLDGDQTYERYIKEKPLESITTSDQGLAVFKKIKSDVVILETKSIENYSINRDIKLVNIKEYTGEEIIIKNYRSTNNLPETGTLSIYPYILVSIVGIGLFVINKKKNK
ncbi:prealbumin-like fold domain-containing protein [Peptoniphilus porci]|uniref:Uncharacterized protein n=1 Tax=Peptoniphilus porci TaxID=2652280 RepID=A0A1U7LX14_9FIRM|nr:prealbumin-like fold domain-containing protein [Peptoniphilus porci]OLR61619.1 hypothetical protein BIV18_09705 [Peptoniphilus porci]